MMMKSGLMKNETRQTATFQQRALGIHNTLQTHHISARNCSVFRGSIRYWGQFLSHDRSVASYRYLTRKQRHALRELQDNFGMNGKSGNNFLHPRTAEALVSTMIGALHQISERSQDWHR